MISQTILARGTPPTITSVSPLSGSAGAQVTISGTGFSSTPLDNIVRLGGASAHVLDASDTSLIVSVPSSATYGPVTVMTGGLTAASDRRFILTFGGGGIGPSSYYDPTVVGHVSAQTAYLADMDGDGALDLVTPGGAQNYVSVLRNTSTDSAISFADSVNFTTAWYGAHGAAIGDLDGDGKLDLVIACEGAASPGRVSVLQNTSTPGKITSSSFAAPVNFSTATGFVLPRDVAIADFNGDGKPDIVACGGALSTSSYIFTYRNVISSGVINTSSFVGPGIFETGLNPGAIDVADINGDGKPDVIVANRGSSFFSVFLNSSTADSIMFLPRTDISGPSAAWELALGDFDGDGRMDVVVTNSGASSAMVFRNTSVTDSVSFDAPVTLPTLLNPYGLTVSDLDGDGKPDIVITNPTQQTVSVFRNISVGGTFDSTSFSTRIDYLLNSVEPYAVVASDLDGDSKPDIAAVTYGATGGPVSLLRNRVSNGFAPAPILTGTSEDLNAVSFVTATNGSIAGNKGVVRTTTDGGSTWTASNTGVDTNLTGIKLIGSVGFITGGGGLICISTNGGGSWVPFTTGTTERFNGSSFTSSTSGWAVGTGGIICNYNGSSWTPQSAGVSIEFKGVYAVGSTGFAVGAAGTICRFNGTSWVQQSSGVGVTFNDVAFVNDQLGYVVGAGGTICRTTNGGTNWTALSTGLGSLNYRSIKVVNANLIWATADGGVVVQSTDGGISWTSSYLGGANLAGIEFVGGQGIIVGNGGIGYSFQKSVLSVREPNPGAPVPSAFSLAQNYPNPFNPVTEIRFQVSKPGHLTLKVYDLLGREIATLVNDELHPGTYRTSWDASAQASGVYYYRLQTRGYTDIKKMMVIK